MNLTVLRTYALQLEEVAKLELAELARSLQNTVERMAMLESQARADADRYLSQVREGSTVTQVYTQFDAMDQAIAARKGMEQAHAAQQAQWATKRDELLEAMQYRKKLDLLGARAVQEQRRRQDKQDQQLLDERAWRRSSLRTGERA
ncbi:MAG: flagellar FliJ family protein [Nitrospira defluvii]|nr:flagellar FliJ family protein [Nitrospira defluvii]